jgi:hypothetical protein
MKAEADEAGGEIQAIYYCPHDWDEGCDCRKPAPGMLFQAQREFNLDLSGTVLWVMTSVTRLPQSGRAVLLPVAPRSNH